MKLPALNTYAFLAFIMYDQIAHQRDISVYMASNLNAPLCKNSYHCLYFIKLTWKEVLKKKICKYWTENWIWQEGKKVRWDKSKWLCLNWQSSISQNNWLKQHKAKNFKKIIKWQTKLKQYFITIPGHIWNN